jgi:two-component system, NarL family, sensor histidine kinase EvgS
MRFQLTGFLWLTARPPRLVRGARLGAGLLHLLLGWVLSMGGAQALGLSEAEQAWLQSHGRIKVVVGTQQEPYFRSTAPGAPPSGFAVEAFELLAGRAGLSWEYVHAVSLADGVERIRRGEADMVAFLRMSPQRAVFLSRPAALIPVESVFVTRKDASSFTTGDGLVGRRIGAVEGGVNAEQLARHYPQAQVTHYPTQRALLEAVATGSVEAAMSEIHVAIHNIEANLLSNLQLRRVPALGEDAYGPAVRRDLPHLHSILAKAMETVTSAEMAALARRWLPTGVNTAFGQETAELSPAERDWVLRRGELQAGFDPNFMPFTRAGALGGFEGMGADLLRAAAAKAGLRVAGHHSGSFSKVLDMARDGRVNVVVGMARNPERLAAFHFIGPWAVAPTVVVMPQESGALGGDLDSLGQGRVALLRDHFLLPQIQSRLPSLRLQQYDTQREVLEAVSRGEAEAGIGNAYVVNLLINERYTGSLRINGVVPGGDSELYLAVPKREAELARVLERAYAALSPTELAQIRQQWLLARIEPGLPWRTLLQWGLPAGLALLAVMTTLYLANRRLRQAHARIEAARRQAEEATAARGRFLAYLAHEVRGGVGGIAAGARLLVQRQASSGQRPLLAAMAQSAEQVCGLLETTLHDEVDFARGFTLQPAPLDLASWWDETLAPQRLRASGQGLRLVETPPAGRVLADGPRLAQVLGNVLSNAIKFTRTGSVEAHARWTGVEGQAGTLHIEVCDEGPGLPEGERLRIFEPYAQGDAGQAVGHGVGLGLAIARQLVLAMGGQIEALPREGAGSRFVISLPLQPPTGGT